MPRKAKETVEKEEIVKKEEVKITKKASTSTKKVASASKEKTGTLASSAKRNASTTKKASTKSAVAKGSSSTSSRAKAKTKSKASTQTASTPKKSRSSSTKKKAASKAKVANTRSKKSATPIETPEYYDLPYHYNQTVVKVLAQTPKNLFVYWDVSEEDRKHYEEQFGPNFFHNTVPFLRVKNETLHYSFDVDVDDFANGWYLSVEDAKCNYSIELLRKQRPYTEKVIEAPVYITSSNHMETPNDHILFDTNYNAVYFRNVKTNQVTSKNMSQITLLQKVGKIYNIYDFYKRIYKNEDINEIFDLNNPTSGNPTSTFR